MKIVGCFLVIALSVLLQGTEGRGGKGNSVGPNDIVKPQKPRASSRNVISFHIKPKHPPCKVKFTKVRYLCKEADVGTDEHRCDLSPCHFSTKQGYDECGKPVTLWKDWVVPDADACKYEKKQCSRLDASCRCSTKFCWTKYSKQYFNICGEWYYENVRVMYPCGCECYVFHDLLPFPF